MSSKSRIISIFPIVLCLIVLMVASGTSAKLCIGPCSKFGPCDPLCIADRCNDRCKVLHNTSGACTGRSGSQDPLQCCCDLD
ncbi:hypothetical protein LINGRAHAP2_LOCUS19331 [Linum grandiflorum]